jgi:hypothetical protein
MSNMTLAHLDGWLLTTGYTSCRRVVQVPLRLLRQRGVPGGAAVVDVARRLRCEHCGKSPQAVWLVEDPRHGASGFPCQSRRRHQSGCCEARSAAASRVRIIHRPLPLRTSRGAHRQISTTRYDVRRDRDAPDLR